MSDGWLELGVIFAIAVLIAARHEIRRFLTAPFRAASRRRRLKRERREAERRQRKQQQQALARERADSAERQRQLEEIRRALDEL